MNAPFVLFGIGGLIYIGGAIIYILRIPERWRPGTFDLCGASHQIFHFAVIIACCLHYYTNVATFAKRQTYECPVWPDKMSDTSIFALL